MSQSSTIFRSNANSGFYSAVKSRKSASNQSGCKLLYNQEVNYCPSCRTKVETFASNSAAYGSKMVFELPNFAHLSECFLKVRWNAGAAASEATNRNLLIENAIVHLCQTIKLIVDGVEICRTTPEAVLAHFYKHSTNEQRRAFQEMTGGYKTRSVLTKFNATTDTRSILFPEARNTASCVYYLPINFWFSALDEQMNRAVPLGVLERVFIEIETADAEAVNIQAGTSSAIAIDKMSVVSFLTELDPSEESMYRNSSFESGGEPLSILGKTILQHSETGLAHTTGSASTGSIKLNMFAGQIGRLYICCLSESDDRSTIYNSGNVVNTSKSRFAPVEMDKITLRANGVEIYKMEELDEREDKLENWVNRDFDCGYTTSSTNVSAGGQGTGWSRVSSNSALVSLSAGDMTESGGAGSMTKAELATSLDACLAKQNFSQSFDTSSINPDHIYCLNFKNVGADQRDSSMTGSINFSNLSVPTLDYSISANAPTATTTASGVNGTYKIVVIAVQHNLITYSTNNAGRVALRSVS